MLLERLRHLWAHASWADARLLDAVRAGADTAPETIREYAHIVSAEETWLARLEQRPPRAAIWPDASIAELHRLHLQTHAAYQTYLAGLREADLSVPIAYANSAGQVFTNSVAEILLQVVLHGQYHRGKINLLLRQAGQDPAPADYIAFVRGVPAATGLPPPRDPQTG